MTGLGNLADQLTNQLGLGTLAERDQVKQTATEVLRRQGYAASVRSLRHGRLILEAGPAEASLLRYDKRTLREALAPHGVTEITVRSTPAFQPESHS